jgi:hypothetical protein
MDGTQNQNKAIYDVSSANGFIILCLPEDGSRASFRNVVFKEIIGRWIKS